MLMADTMAIVFAVLGLMLALPGLWLLCSALWPNAVAGATDRTDEGLVRPFATGLAVTISVLILAALMNNLFGSLGSAGAVALMALFWIYSSAGVAGLATTIGRRLGEYAGDRNWKVTLRGSVVLELTYLFPILGWFIVLPASTVVGCGAVTMALLRMKPGRVHDREPDPGSHPHQRPATAPLP